MERCYMLNWGSSHSDSISNYVFFGSVTTVGVFCVPFETVMVKMYIIRNSSVPCFWDIIYNFEGKTLLLRELHKKIYHLFIYTLVYVLTLIIVTSLYMNSLIIYSKSSIHQICNYFLHRMQIIQVIELIMNQSQCKYRLWKSLTT